MTEFKCPRCALELIFGITDKHFILENKKYTCIYCSVEENKEYFNKRIAVLEQARYELSKFKSIKEYRESKYKVLRKRPKITPDYLKDYTCDNCNIQIARDFKICLVCYSRVKYTCEICNFTQSRVNKSQHEKTKRHLEKTKRHLENI